jgi:hypothetical protein
MNPRIKLIVDLYNVNQALALNMSDNWPTSRDCMAVRS